MPYKHIYSEIILVFFKKKEEGVENIHIDFSSYPQVIHKIWITFKKVEKVDNMWIIYIYKKVPKCIDLRGFFDIMNHDVLNTEEVCNP